MNRRDFIKLLSKGAALLGAVPFVGIPEIEKEMSKAECLGKGIADGVADGFEPFPDEIYFASADKFYGFDSGTLIGDYNAVSKFQGTAWEQINDQ